MSTSRAGMICIRLNDHHMTLLGIEAAERNLPIQICAQNLLTAHLDTLDARRTNPTVADQLRTITDNIIRITEQLRDANRHVTLLEQEIN